MSKEDRLILDYMALLRHLSVDLRLRLIAALTESVRRDKANEPDDEGWKKLFGAWSDTDDHLAEEIRAARMPGREVPSLNDE